MREKISIFERLAIGLAVWVFIIIPVGGITLALVLGK